MAWCRGKGLQPTDAEDVTQEVLLRVARKVPTFDYTPGSNFSGWLRTIWLHAWHDFVTDRTPGKKGSGDFNIHERLAEVEGGDLTSELEKEFDQELLREALARVRPRVSLRDWAIFEAIVFAEKSGSEVAAEHKMTLAAVGMVKLRVQARVRQEIQTLEGSKS
jgi:RNA polymerase sigma-70 factor (ECF subfamily)